MHALTQRQCLSTAISTAPSAPCTRQHAASSQASGSRQQQSWRGATPTSLQLLPAVHQLHSAAATPANRGPACQHGCWSYTSSSSSSGSRSRRAAHVHPVRVFDKLRNMLGGNSSGWAAPPEGRPAAAGAADEEEEGAELVRIDTDSQTGLGGTTEDAFGPLAVLLVGFMQQEVDAFRAMMIDMDADIVKLIPCTKTMLGSTLLQAFETDFPQYEQPPLGQRRAMFFSGMYGSEVTEVISAYRDAGMPPCVFAGLVPNNADRTVGELLEAVWRDHAAMMVKLQQQQQQQAVEDSY